MGLGKREFMDEDEFFQDENLFDEIYDEPEDISEDLKYHKQQVRKEKIMNINELQNKGLL